MIYYIVREQVSREIIQVEAEYEKSAFDIALDRYDARAQGISESCETVYRTARPEEIAALSQTRV